MKLSQEDLVCGCEMEAGPHVAGHGDCQGNPQSYNPPFCGACGQEDSGHVQDFGIGPYEFWGQKGVDTRLEWVSTCCDAPLYAEREMLTPAEQPEPPEPEYEPDEEVSPYGGYLDSLEDDIERL